MLARQQFERPRLEHVQAILQSRTQQHSQQATMTTDFWLVPRAGCVAEPAWAKDWAVSEAHVRDNFQVPEEADLSAVWIVDAGCPRHALGRGVKRIAFQDRLATSMSHTPATPGGSSSAARPSEPPWTPSGTPMPTGRTPPSAPALATPASAAAPAPVPATPASAPATSASAPEVRTKRQRVLKAMMSDEIVAPEELEAASMEELIAKIKRRLKHDTFTLRTFRPPPLCTSGRRKL
jgi:hypothetical protein